MAVTTLGRQLVKDALPQKYKKYAQGDLNKGTITKLTTQLAKQDPDGYIDVLQKLNHIGQRVVSTYGKDTTITLDDIDAGAQVKNARKQLQQIIQNVINDPKLTQQQKQQKIIDLGYKYTTKLRQLGVQDAKRRKTGIANQIASGSRGNAVQLMQLITGDMMMKDAMNRDIPYLALMPYSDGDSPMSYYASAMSNRKSTYDVQAATGQVGYLSKQAQNITHATPISTFDCGTTKTGIKVKAADNQNVGAILLRPFKQHKAGSIVTQQMLAEASDDDFIVIRSPNTCKAHNGVCALCSGLQQSGELPAVGSYVALNAAKSFTEPLTQAGISCLHPGTPVRMADWSVKPIRDIKIGDMVMGSDMQGNCRPVKVTHVFDNGLQPMYRTVFKAGYNAKKTEQIISTVTHKFIMAQKTTSGIITAYRPLGQGYKDKWFISPKSIKAQQGSVHQPLAFLLGFLCGDGCYSKGVKGQVHFSCADKSLVQYLQQYVDQFGMYVHLCAGQKIYYSIGKKQRSSKKSLIKLKLMQYGMDGKYAWQKTLPNNFRQWDQWSIKQFISGLIVADGHIGIHRYSDTATGGFKFNINNTSRQLLEQVSECLARFAAINIADISQSNAGHPRTLYMLQTGNVDNIYKLLNWVQLKGIKQTTQNKMLKQLQNSKLLKVTDKFRRLKIISQQFVGVCQALDIQVDHPDHLFLLRNSLIVSNSKHGSGVGGIKQIDPEGEDQPTGFASVQRMFSAPATFPGGAVLSQVAGRVNAIKEAPQGGHYITVGTNTMYASTARTVTVKPGDVVQAGDMLTNGVPNPAQIVQYKGIGQGRQYFTKKMSQLLKKTGAGTHRRNVEQFSRAFLNKVKITKDQGFKGYYPGDIANYDDVVQNWQPRQGSKQLQLDKAIGGYLQQPIMYYTIGTKITPSVVKNLKEMDITSGIVNNEPPPFQPVFVRSRQFTLNDKNWLPRLAGQRLKQGLFDAARSGLTDQYDSPSFINRIISHQYKPTN